MSTLEQQLHKLRSFNAAIRAYDPQLNEEMADRGGVREVMTSAPDSVEGAVERESIVLRRTRPVLFVRDDAVQLVFQDQADSAIWKARLANAASFLKEASRAVGRIELVGGRLDWVGTGWLVADDVLVTNRHVATEFAVRSGAQFQFRVGASGSIVASVDFLEEHENPQTLDFRLLQTLHIEPPPGPDVAFFRVEPMRGNRKLAAPIRLAERVSQTLNVATIGYPAYDSRIPEAALMEQIFGKIYNKKRLSPGSITRVETARLHHDCTTLGGNSGSVVLDLDHGVALGLHFAGGFLATNYAVRADVVRRLLDDLRHTRKPVPRPRPAKRETLLSRATSASTNAHTTSITVPLTLTISFGTPGREIDHVDIRSVPNERDDDHDDAVEARPEDYADRKGYVRDFLGADFEVPLPEVLRDADDVVEVESGCAPANELRYEHFSVVMSHSRRMCFLSAANIDGGQSRKTKRVDWKWDPRLPRELQIKDECYGNPPKFSRGHMTRREDPAWGTTTAAQRGNADSMHVTNATPQMQAFNSPIWLALEDYALSHAREDDMKISVFTGPYFSAEDPEHDGVLIPRSFWKVIAFIHDDTGELCATGYEMNQEDSLPRDDEFVFGQFVSPHLNVATQVSIRSIEARSGISFGPLVDVDPFVGDEEGLSEDEAHRELSALEEIRFVR